MLYGYSGKVSLKEDTGLHITKAENEKLEVGSHKTPEAKRLTNEQRVAANRTLEAVFPPHQRLSGQIEDLKKQLQIERSTPNEELHNLEKKIQKLEEENTTMIS